MLVPLLAALAAPAIVPQEPLGGVGGTQIEFYGETVETIGDVDGDGIDDVLVGAPEYVPPTSFVRTGRAEVLSGATLASPIPTRIYELFGPFGGCAGAPGQSNFGSAAAGGRDVTGDGVADFAVSAYVSGFVSVFDGATGIDVLEGTGFDLNRSCLQRNGFKLELANIDGDAHADLLVSQVSLAVVGRSRVRVYSGASIANPGASGPQELYSRPSPVINDDFGTALAVLGDLDGDGLDDFAVGAPRTTSTWPGGSVAVVSGASGSILHRFGPAAGGFRFGASLAIVEDLDGDGVPDLAIGDPPGPASGSQGSVEVVSGAWIASAGAMGTRTLFTAAPSGGPTIAQFGLDLECADVNDDGFPDLLASRMDDGVLGWDVVSGRSGETMWSFTTEQGAGPPHRPAAATVSVGSAVRFVLGAPNDRSADASRPEGYGFAYVVRAHDAAGRSEALGVGCPCGNDDAAAGCANSTGAGARLAPERGTVSLAGGALELLTTGLPPNAFGLLIGGMPSTPQPVQNGLLGLTGPIRTAPGQANPSGQVITSGDLLGDLAALAPSFGATAPMVGVPFALQFAYRDADCSGASTPALNLSNAYVVVPRP
ncbi:MAG: integrin alpha [Planctomycetota bacterium]